MSDWKRSAFLLLMLEALMPEFFDCSPDQPNPCENKYYLPSHEDFNIGSYCEETLHKLDCSVGPRKSIEGDSTLHCRIRRKKGWEAFEKTLGNLSLCHYGDCEPSQLTSLRVVTIKHAEYLDEVHSWSTIQLNFTVPKLKATVEGQFYTGGILMNFNSDSQMPIGDYKTKSLYRLFEFSNYSYSSPENDIIYQRILSFPCLTGFQHEPCQSDNYKVYTLTLKSFSNSKTKEGRTIFTELSYNITIYSYYVHHPDKWKSTIAVAFFPREKDVTVLFDPAPDSVSVTYYNVSLFNVDVNTTYRYEIIGQSTKHCFKDVVDGTYFISIMVVSEGRTCSGDCKLTRSHEFTVRNPNRITGVINYDNNAELIYLSVGCSMGLPVVLAILVVCYCRWRTKKINKKTDQDPLPKVLLIYSNATQECCDIAFEFSRFCRENLHIDILNDNLNHDNNSVTIETNSSPWYRDTLSKSSAAIILWTPLHKPKENEDHGDADEIKSVVRLAVESQCKNGLKIICIYFDKRHKRSIPNIIQTKARLFHFPKKSDEFCTYILGHKMLRDTTIRNELKILIRRFSLNTRYMETTFQHVIPHHDSVSDEETKDTDRILAHVMRHEVLASKSDGIEAQPLIHHDDLRKKSSENHFVPSDINKQCSKQRSQCSKTLAIVHRQIQTPCDSVSTLELFGSGELPNSKISCQSSRDKFSECTQLSDLSVSCLKSSMMDITSDDNSSQSSGYAHCEPVSPVSSSTPENESGVPLISRTPHHYERLQPMEADYDFISDNKEIHSDSDDNSIVHCTTHPMSPRQTIIQDRTISYFDKYSLSSGSVRSSEIDLSEFVLPDGIS